MRDRHAGARARGERIHIHLFVVREGIDGWHTDVHTTWYRALTRAGLTEALTRAGFEDVRWHMPDESGYYQPTVTAHAARSRAFPEPS